MAHERDDTVALVGLVLEAATGFRRLAGPKWERQLGLPPQSSEVLIRLVRAPDGRLRMTDLAARTSLTPSGLTRAIDRMRAAGLVERESCSEDRRVSFACLTPEGARRAADALTAHERRLDELLATLLSAEERGALAAMLERVRDHLAAGGCGSEIPGES